MKGGIAAMVAAVEALRELGVELAGDVIVNTVSEEETTGAGGLVAARTLRADAAIVPEPTGLSVCAGCRGSLLAAVLLEGRAGHAGIPPAPPDEGGAVNAIDKARLVLDAIQRLNERWAATHRHPRLAPAHCVPTAIHGGEWIVSHPAACRIECHLEFLPEQADAGGWGAAARREFEAAIRRAAEQDEWLLRHPPRVEWLLGGVPSAEVAEDEPIVRTLLGVHRDLTSDAQIGGFDNWSDAATLIREAGIPAVNYGPGDLRLAHTAREHVPVAELVACAQGIALTAMRFCGLAA
jgi:acetylornithine deacetylase